MFPFLATIIANATGYTESAFHKQFTEATPIFSTDFFLKLPKLLFSNTYVSEIESSIEALKARLKLFLEVYRMKIY